MFVSKNQKPQKFFLLITLSLFVALNVVFFVAGFKNADTAFGVDLLASVTNNYSYDNEYYDNGDGRIPRLSRTIIAVAIAVPIGLAAVIMLVIFLVLRTNKDKIDSNNDNDIDAGIGNSNEIN